MQKLTFEAAWDKTIAPQDRKNIETIFENNRNNKEEGIEFIFLWEAVNHKDELLVGVLIQNFNEDVLIIEEDMIQYNRENQIVAKDAFTVPIAINPKTSMPWTFIYSNPTINSSTPTYKINGYR